MKTSIRTTFLAALSFALACATTQPAEKAAPAPKPTTSVVSAKAEVPAKPRQKAPAPSFRDHQPPPLARKVHFEAPVPVRKTLKNGLVVLIHENHRLPLVAMEMDIRAGTNADPKGEPGLASFTVNMLNEGTKHYGALKMAEALQEQAIELTAMGTSRDHSTVGLSALKETLPKALDLLAEMIEHPAFRTKDVSRVRSSILAEITQKQGQPRALAQDAMNRALFGAAHPWGWPTIGTLESVKQLHPKDLRKFWRTWYRPNDAVLTVSGDVDPAQLMKEIQRAFGHWKKHALPKLRLAAFPTAKREIDLVPVAHAAQSQVWVGTRLGIDQTSPDAVPLRVANEILGGMFSSRLNMDLREKHGYSYGVRSRLQLEPTGSLWAAAGGIVAAKTVPAVTEYERQMQTFASGEVSDRELDMAKKGMINALPARVETNRAVAALMAHIELAHLPLDYYRKLPAKIQAVTQADVKRVVKQYFRPEDWPIIVAGPPEHAAALGKLGFGKVMLQPVGAVPEKPTAKN